MLANDLDWLDWLKLAEKSRLWKNRKDLAPLRIQTSSLERVEVRDFIPSSS